MVYIFGDVVRSLGKSLRRIAIVLAGVVLLLACIGFADRADASDYQANFESIPAINKFPPRVARWSLTPTVVVCEHAPVSQTQINSAVKFWKDLGHRFYRTQYKHDPLNKCLEKQPTGYIIVHMITQGIDLESGSLAETHFFVDNDSNKIEWAIVYMRPNIRETVLEHEVGHALGYLHYNKINHLMNSKWAQGGWDVDGLKN